MKGIKLITTTFLVCIISLPASADVWLVDSNPSNVADFRDLPEAHDAAAPGDTLYIRGSIFPYTGHAITKQLFIFGPGYFLDENPDTQSYSQSALIQDVDLDFEPGSEGSLVTGLDILRSMDIRASDIVVMRNRIVGRLTISNSNVSVVQNYFLAPGNWNIGLGTNTGVSPATFALNIIVANNYVQGGGGSTENILGTEETDALITNNVIVGNGGIEIYNSTIQNNIFIGGQIEGNLNNIQNNSVMVTP